MKYLRIIVLVISLVGVLSVWAQTPNQNWGKMPQAQMYSTSTMVGSGSSLPISARSGVTLTGSQVGTYACASTGRPHRAKKEENPFGEDKVEGTTTEAYEPGGAPVGDAVLPLMLLLGAYAGVVALRRRKASAES